MYIHIHTHMHIQLSQHASGTPCILSGSEVWSSMKPLLLRSGGLGMAIDGTVLMGLVLVLVLIGIDIVSSVIFWVASTQKYSEKTLRICLVDIDLFVKIVSSVFCFHSTRLS